MKKKLALMLSLVALCLASLALLSACSSSTSSTEDTAGSAEATETPSTEFTLILGFDSGYPPYGYIDDDGNYAGFDIELAQAVCEKLGWDIQLEPIDWDAKDALLEQGNINCIWNGFTMEGREDSYTMSEPYMLNEQVIVTKSGSGIATFEDLAQKTVITQVDSAALEVLEGDQAELAATFASLDTISDYNNAFMQLESDLVDAVACDLSIAAYQIAANPDVYAQLEESLSSEHYAVAFKLGDDEVAEAVNGALRELDEEGFVQELCEKYTDQGIAYENWCLE